MWDAETEDRGRRTGIAGGGREPSIAVYSFWESHGSTLSFWVRRRIP